MARYGDYRVMYADDGRRPSNYAILYSGKGEPNRLHDPSEFHRTLVTAKRSARILHLLDLQDRIISKIQVLVVSDSRDVKRLKKVAEALGVKDASHA
jgi:hypothetical protein